MLPSNFDSLSPAQRLILEQDYVMAKELESVADSAPQGKPIDHCESFLLGHGRDFLRKLLETTLQTRAESFEKKRPGPDLPLRRSCEAQGQSVQNGDDRTGQGRDLAGLFLLQRLSLGGLLRRMM